MKLFVALVAFIVELLHGYGRAIVHSPPEDFAKATTPELVREATRVFMHLFPCEPSGLRPLKRSTKELNFHVIMIIQFLGLQSSSPAQISSHQDGHSGEDS